ncbi:hypothetical protein WN51_13835 [Melipona quadrifasciata]|uniref:Uncharacterized protein n=1 Tax=Melipona quadrifasciata TaxID=166423 RepID=A0A0M8ZYY2_9HYME|nr:hypothetical protein WN51_13835 [Melipona quadrifasciata]
MDNLWFQFNPVVVYLFLCLNVPSRPSSQIISKVLDAHICQCITRLGTFNLQSPQRVNYPTGYLWLGYSLPSLAREQRQIKEEHADREEKPESSYYPDCSRQLSTFAAQREIPSLPVMVTRRYNKEATWSAVLVNGVTATLHTFELDNARRAKGMSDEVEREERRDVAEEDEEEEEEIEAKEVSEDGEVPKTLLALTNNVIQYINTLTESLLLKLSELLSKIKFRTVSRNGHQSVSKGGLKSLPWQSLGSPCAPPSLYRDRGLGPQHLSVSQCRRFLERIDFKSAGFPRKFFDFSFQFAEIGENWRQGRRAWKEEVKEEKKTKAFEETDMNECLDLGMALATEIRYRNTNYWINLFLKHLDHKNASTFENNPIDRERARQTNKNADIVNAVLKCSFFLPAIFKGEEDYSRNIYDTQNVQILSRATGMWILLV